MVATCIGLTSAICAAKIGHPVMAFFIAAYTTVQIAEGLIWHSLDTQNDVLNRIGTTLLRMSLASHALITVVAALLFFHHIPTKARNRSRVKGWLVFLLMLSSVVFVVQNVFSADTVSTKALCKDKREGHEWRCRLNWQFDNLFMLYSLQVLIILSTTYIVFGRKLAWYMHVLLYALTWIAGGATILFTKHHYRIPTRQALSIGVSTLWCFFSAIVAPVSVYILWKFS